MQDRPFDINGSSDNDYDKTQDFGLDDDALIYEGQPVARPRNQIHNPTTGPIPLAANSILKNKYRLDSIIGRGGMGEIWKAFDTVGERDVALKFVPRDIQQYTDEMQRVRETFRAVHALNHQNICPVYALEDDPQYGHFLVMKWLPGKALGEVHRRNADDNNRFPYQMVSRLLEPVAKALDYAHQHGVIHRDVKPGNIILDVKKGKIEDVYLIDFGLASQIRECLAQISQMRFETSGTPSYMPPEQWRGRQQDARTDQYSLAVIAYELYSGHLPFSGTSFELLRSAILQELPERIDNLPSRINQALQRALSKDRQRRYDTCLEFVQALGVGSQLHNSATSGVHQGKLSSREQQRSAASSPSPVESQENDHWFTLMMANPIVRYIGIAFGAVFLMLLGAFLFQDRSEVAKTPTTPITTSSSPPKKPPVTNPAASTTTTPTEGGTSSNPSAINPPNTETTLPPVELPSVLEDNRPEKPITDVLKELQFINCRTRVSDDDWKTIRAQKKPFRVDLGYIPITDKEMKNLQGLKDLQAIDLESSEVSDTGLEFLKDLTQLQAINLRHSYGMITDVGLSRLAGLVNMKSLNLDNCTNLTISSQGLTALAPMTKLQELRLRGCEKLTNGNLADLKNHQQLRFLDLAGATKLTDSGMLHLSKLTALETLYVDQTAISDQGLEYLARLTNLRDISLEGTQITDSGLSQFFRQQPRLRSLSLRNCPLITDGGLSFFAGMTLLEKLSLPLETTDSGLIQLGLLSQLKELDLSGCRQVTNAGLAYLEGLDQIRRLSLAGTNISDAGLARMKNLENLVELDLSDCSQINDTQLDNLGRLVQLRILTLNNTPVTSAGIQKLRETLPISRCTIEISN